ncbi:D-alanyl-D-alanine carboxypeptidase [Phenylobacterium deserti]|uniref:D-alanyl-D-alanine carboxypeptidase n=2 Tax=Phenylobacterium deserti TaxID=1914756 RepID=A0A328ARG3_9CAUL|nr:D-alanyl-D-alanine carboxypeptidase [Phenylobacterium deserti]
MVDLGLAPYVWRDVKFKPSEALRFLGALAAAFVLLGLIVLRVTSCAPLPKPTLPSASPLPPPPAQTAAVDCHTIGWDKAARINGSSLKAMPWAPFGRVETGWETYAPLIAREIGTRCAPDTPGFASALAAWQSRNGFHSDGLVSEFSFIKMKGVVQGRRPIVLLSSRGICAPAAQDSELAESVAGEGYGGKQIQLRHKAFAAYRRMVAAARAEDPRIAEDPRFLQIFSGFRSPAYDAARCAAQGNCNGRERARCSPHRTGLAMDLYVGQAPGYGPDSSADPNRRFMTKTPAYQWLLANAHRFGFVNYPFEPWHWEWTGEDPLGSS